MARPTDEQVSAGIKQSFDDWVADHHEVTIPYCVQDGVKAAFAEWLRVNDEILLEDIIKATASQLSRDLINDGLQDAIVKAACEKLADRR